MTGFGCTGVVISTPYSFTVEHWRRTCSTNASNGQPNPTTSSRRTRFKSAMPVDRNASAAEFA
jgi:hypothetical protein